MAGRYVTVLRLRFVLLVTMTAPIGCAKQGSPADDQTFEDPIVVVSDPTVSTYELGQALSRLRKAADVKEPPSFWADIVSDESYSQEHRARCLVEYFRRHVTLPMPVDEVGKLPRMGEWVSQETILDRSRGTGVWRLEPERGSTIVIFIPRFLGTDPYRQPAIWLRLSRPHYECRVDDFLALVHGKKSDPKVQITEIAYGLPWKE